MTLNEHVNVDHTRFEKADVFTPDEGYALWRDDEEGNLDENGEPLCYWLTYIIQKSHSEEYAPHIWAKLIDETMEVFGKTPETETAAATPMKARMMTASVQTEESHTYIDENSVERQKKGVY